MHITNMGKGSRVLPLKNGKQVEIAPGQTVDFPDDEWAELAKRATVQADIEAGVIVAVVAETATGGITINRPNGDVTVTTSPEADARVTVQAPAPADAEAPKRRGRLPKSKPDGATSGEDA